MKSIVIFFTLLLSVNCYSNELTLLNFSSDDLSEAVEESLVNYNLNFNWSGNIYFKWVRKNHGDRAFMLKSSFNVINELSGDSLICEGSYKIMTGKYEIFNCQ